MAGYIKLHRSLKDWEWYDDHNATRMLVHLLIHVNYKDKKWKGLNVKKGSLVCSWATLSDAVGLSVQQTRTALGKLIKCGEVTKKPTNKYMLLTLVKWEKMQIEKVEPTSKPTNEQQTNNNQITTTKEGKEIKETNTQKSVGEIEVDLSGGEGGFKDQLLKDLKQTKYNESDFLDNWTTCRKHFLKTETHIKSLNFHERTEFERVKKTYSKEEINAAMQTLFKQERIPVEAMVLRPKHFLEKFDTYYSAGKSTKIYATKQKQTEY